ncbi:MAG: hypothetical protein B7Z61_01080 [Acidobacteria bacterium 37-71-11]|nr:MAG: hypothetical protein B7Z61_01080 [Acidobacteria bacterium 37-71-11]
MALANERLEEPQRSRQQRLTSEPMQPLGTFTRAWICACPRALMAKIGGEVSDSVAAMWSGSHAPIHTPQ